MYMHIQVFIYTCILLLLYIIVHVGSVRVYDLESNKLLCHSKYTSGGNSLVWAPLSVDPNGLTLITGHSDMVLRYSIDK